MRDELDDNSSALAANEPVSSATFPTSASPKLDDSKTESAEKPSIVEDVLIEEVSIDGMCGVY